MWGVVAGDDRRRSRLSGGWILGRVREERSAAGGGYRGPRGQLSAMPSSCGSVWGWRPSNSSMATSRRCWSVLLRKRSMSCSPRASSITSVIRWPCCGRCAACAVASPSSIPTWVERLHRTTARSRWNESSMAGPTGAATSSSSIPRAPGPRGRGCCGRPGAIPPSFWPFEEDLVRMCREAGFRRVVDVDPQRNGIAANWGVDPTNRVLYVCPCPDQVPLDAFPFRFNRRRTPTTACPALLGLARSRFREPSAVVPFGANPTDQDATPPLDGPHVPGRVRQGRSHSPPPESGRRPPSPPVSPFRCARPRLGRHLLLALRGPLSHEEDA